MIRQTRPEAAAPEMKFDVAMRVAPGNRRQMIPRNNQQARFLPTFSHGTGSRSFIELALAAWEFVHAGQWDVARAFSDQKASGRLNHRDSNAFGTRHDSLSKGTGQKAHQMTPSGLPNPVFRYTVAAAW
jgi:hypothetical protein